MCNRLAPRRWIRETKKQDGRPEPWRGDHEGRPFPEGPVGEQAQPRQPWRQGLQVPSPCCCLPWLHSSGTPEGSMERRTEAQQEPGENNRRVWLILFSEIAKVARKRLQMQRAPKGEQNHRKQWESLHTAPTVQPNPQKALWETSLWSSCDVCQPCSTVKWCILRRVFRLCLSSFGFCFLAAGFFLHFSLSESCRSPQLRGSSSLELLWITTSPWKPGNFRKSPADDHRPPLLAPTPADESASFGMILQPTAAVHSVTSVRVWKQDG